MEHHFKIQEKDLDQLTETIELLDAMISMMGFTKPDTTLQISVDSLTGTLAVLHRKLLHVKTTAQWTGRV